MEPEMLNTGLDKARCQSVLSEVFTYVQCRLAPNHRGDHDYRREGEMTNSEDLPGTARPELCVRCDNAAKGMHFEGRCFDTECGDGDGEDNGFHLVARVLEDASRHIEHLEARLIAQTHALEEAQDQIVTLTARAVLAERHETFELLSKGSAVEQMEKELRTKLAETEIALKQYGQHLKTCDTQHLRRYRRNLHLEEVDGEIETVATDTLMSGPSTTCTCGFGKLLSGNELAALHTHGQETT